MLVSNDCEIMLAKTSDGNCPLRTIALSIIISCTKVLIKSLFLDSWDKDSSNLLSKHFIIEYKTLWSTSVLLSSINRNAFPSNA